MFPNDGYIILLNLNQTTEEKVTWNDKIVHVSPTVDTAIALASIKVHISSSFATLFACFDVTFNFRVVYLYCQYERQDAKVIFSSNFMHISGGWSDGYRQ